jgi:hypothetical protein
MRAQAVLVLASPLQMDPPPLSSSEGSHSAHTVLDPVSVLSHSHVAHCTHFAEGESSV